MATRLGSMLLSVAAMSACLPAFAHGDGADARHATSAAAKPEQTRFGIAGDRAKATRTIVIDMADTMRFEPTEVVVRRNETVRFVVRNRGAAMHEMVIGTPEDLTEHAALMKRFPDMEHDAPHMAHVKPGATREIVWRFNRAGTFQFACLAPGHFEAGMVGRVVVR
ncbi:MAG TPA: cupredoxin family protein [Methylomirabilota bacterium]|nr:cupredoxin family protein [Methylomirabilota bacterium]